MSQQTHPVVIVGSGIAGLAAAIYAGRAGNEPLVLRGDSPGGQLTLTTDVANYPGFPDGVGGSELIQRMTEQAETFGAEFENAVVESVEASARPFRLTLSNGTTHAAQTVIVASGASARTLGVPGEDALLGYGVSTCATCDGAFFRDDEMIVVGGGDAAHEEATFLTKFAETVYLVHRREEVRAEQYWQDTVQEHVDDGTIERVFNSEVVGVEGTQADGIDSVSVVTHPDGHPSEKLDAEETAHRSFDVAALFLAIGHTPNTAFLTETAVELDERGYVDIVGGTGGGRTETAVAGVFAAGDVVDSHYQQAATASGMGVQAALDVDAALESRD